MQKEADFQLAPVMKLFDFSTQISKDAKLAFQRSASTTASFVSYLSASKTAKKQIQPKDVVEAVRQIAIPGLQEALDLFLLGLEAGKKTSNDDEQQNGEVIDDEGVMDEME
ncbi:hypothetical protein SS50377_21753 [Spironucleus salmonicida]|uniref:Transcription factor CBF/NF-Y/archaeal histone domain-containing protein n=1 Tax=Spironucleus salmonicida TaxID=348837 RepID=V6LLG4_9EUKA|nr:hypothetical protein SS50377_21753 [Spironucleus salmonicida]|eukprot:EST45392.1 hypothetical protein SS50377_14667 [Spironucleus salmonicida]